MSKEAAEFMNAYIKAEKRDPMGLEFEKVYAPFLLVAKKNYAGLMWKPVSDEEGA